MRRHDEPSLYDRVGGEATIMAAVGILYEKLLADDATRPFFEHLELEALVKKQIAFLACAFGGPEAYRGRDLRTAHRQLVASKGLGDAAFDAVARHLAATLTELELEPAVIDEVLGLIGATRGDVLDR
jgi:hemoglobin